MKQALLIMAPWDRGRALAIATALAQRGSLGRLFFYQRGVEQLNTNALPTQGEGLAQQWSELIQAFQLEAIACVTSAMSAGVMDATQAAKYQRHPTLAQGAELGGLGQLADMLENERVVTLK
ncbi:MAG: DsrE family protein [Litorivicinus sp.]